MKEFKDSYFCRLNLFMLIIESNVLTISSKFAHLLELVPDIQVRVLDVQSISNSRKNMPVLLSWLVG
jgi:hypothetical protein